jgi:ArsR family transcriptional regulator, arsenate/arsenite/antimonite-responsive transcriptional repressor
MTSTTADTLVCSAGAGGVPVTDAEAATAGETLAIVADPMRWRIVSLLADAELCTIHLQDLLGAKQNLVSHHLKVLREAHVVQTAPCGRYTYYRLRAGALDGLSAAVATLAAASHGDVARRPC